MKFSDYKSFTIYTLIVIPILCIMPWMHGPYWADVIGTLICSHVIFGVLMLIGWVYTKWKDWKDWQP